MKCPKRQHENEDGAKFCEECTAPLREGADALLHGLLGDNDALIPVKWMLTEQTGGNPSFLKESVRSLVETKVPPRCTVKWACNSGWTGQRRRRAKWRGAALDIDCVQPNVRFQVWEMVPRIPALGTEGACPRSVRPRQKSRVLRTKTGVARSSMQRSPRNPKSVLPRRSNIFAPIAILLAVLSEFPQVLGTLIFGQAWRASRGPKRDHCSP